MSDIEKKRKPGRPCGSKSIPKLKKSSLKPSENKPKKSSTPKIKPKIKDSHLDIAELVDKYLELESELSTEDIKETNYITSNKIEFFGIVDPVRGLKGPNPKQKELLSAWDDPTKKVFIYSGGNRLGKTTVGTIVAISTMIGYWPWDKTKKFKFSHDKPRKVRYVGQDWEKHVKTVLVPALEEWWPKNRVATKKKNNVGVDAFWRDEKTGSTLEIMSNKQESELHEGWAGDLIVYDEPCKRDVRIANARGLIDRKGRELFCMTLLKEAWIDREVIKAVKDDGTPDTSVFHVNGSIWDNEGFGITTEGIDQFSKTLTEDEKSARLDGVPSYMSGLVYSTFKRTTHLKKRFVVPLDWIIDVGIDVHPRERQAVLFCATSPKNERYLVNEIWDNGDGTWVGEQIIRCITQNMYRVGQIIIDPLSKGDQNNEDTTFDKVQKVLWRYGFRLDTASKDKDSGILEVKNHLKGPNNEPSLFIFDDLIRTIYEIEGYMWDEKTQKCKDEDDHMMENLYRILLLNTNWHAMEEESSNTNIINSNTCSVVGGY